ncbi:hypothetical protein [Enterococcus phage vB_Efm3_KEN20]
MIGDFILWQKRVWHEMFCIHDYHWVSVEDKPHFHPVIAILVCKKCGRKPRGY